MVRKLNFFFGKKTEAVYEDSAPLRAANYVVVDTELTGLDERRDSIVSIGAVRMSGGRIDLGGAFYAMMEPETALTRDSVVIHGITPSEVSGRPGIGDTMSGFMDYIGQDIIVGHFVGIDMEFINKEAARTVGHKLTNPAVDTYSICRWLARHNGGRALPDSHDLYDIAMGMGIPVRGAHNSMMDAFITAQVFQMLMPRLAEAGIEDLGELVELGDPFKGGDRFNRPVDAYCF